MEYVLSLYFAHFTVLMEYIYCIMAPFCGESSAELVSNVNSGNAICPMVIFTTGSANWHLSNLCPRYVTVLRNRLQLQITV